MIDYVYSIIVRWRNKQFDTGAFPSYSSDIPVISVGNITTGGTGKSPFVQMLARHFHSTGKKVAIIGRGYKRSTKGFLLVSDGQNLCTDVRKSGDELFMHATALPNVTVIADEQRNRAIQWIEQQGNYDIILLDDGFQHRYTKRDIDIVLIDKKTFSTRLVPYGHLREPLTSLHRATVICFSDLVHDNEKSSLNAMFKDISPFQCTYSTILRHIRPAWNLSNNTQIHNQKCNVVTSIAHPERFHLMLQNNGWHINEKFIFSDHYLFKEKDVTGICQHISKRENILLMTTKDEGKLSVFKHIFQQYSIECYVVEIETSIDNAANFYSYINSIITKKHDNNSIN